MLILCVVGINFHLRSGFVRNHQFRDGIVLIASAPLAPRRTPWLPVVRSPYTGLGLGKSLPGPTPQARACGPVVRTTAKVASALVTLMHGSQSHCVAAVVELTVGRG